MSIFTYTIVLNDNTRIPYITSILDVNLSDSTVIESCKKLYKEKLVFIMETIEANNRHYNRDVYINRA